MLALLGGASEGLDQEATGRDNIVSLGVQLGETPAAMRRRIDDVTEFSGLAARIDHPVYSYSTGMQARLRFSILTSLRPDILLLDEGLGAADAEFAQRADERLREFMSSAGIVVLASHGDDLLRSQCDTAVWLDQGRVRDQGGLERSWPITTRRTFAMTLPTALVASAKSPAFDGRTGLYGSRRRHAQHPVVGDPRTMIQGILASPALARSTHRTEAGMTDAGPIDLNEHDRAGLRSRVDAALAPPPSA